MELRDGPYKAAGTLPDAIWSNDGREGTLTILGKGERSESRPYARMLEEAEAGARGLVKLGVAPGDRVGVVVAPSFPSLTGVLAVWRSGATLVVIPPPARIESRSDWGQRAAALTERAGARTSIAESPFSPPPPGQVVRLDDIATDRGPLPRSPGPADPAVIKFTSGTTATPRGILKSHASLLASARSSLAAKGGLDPARDRRLGWTPLHRQALGSDVLYPMALGLDSTLLPSDLFSARPLRWLTEISKARATYSSAPTFAYRVVAQHLEGCSNLGLDLSCWRVAQCGGEVVSPDALERFVRATAPYGFDPAALTPSYGTSESSGLTARPHGHGILVDRVDRQALASGQARPATADASSVTELASVGAPRPGVAIRIVDEAGHEHAERHVGEIVVHSPGMMEGYLDDPEATAAVLQDGWFWTGDLGYLADGELYISGRKKDVIIVHGKNYSATDIEEVVASLDELETAACVAIGISDGHGEALVVVIEAAGADDALSDAVQRRIWQHVGIAARDVVIVPSGSLPRTSNGKLQRGRVRALYTAAELPTAPAVR